MQGVMPQERHVTPSKNANKGRVRRVGGLAVVTILLLDAPTEIVSVTVRTCLSSSPSQLSLFKKCHASYSTAYNVYVFGTGRGSGWWAGGWGGGKR